MLPGEARINLHDLAHDSLVGYVPCRCWTTKPLTMAGEERDDLDHDLSDLSVRGVIFFFFFAFLQE